VLVGTFVRESDEDWGTFSHQRIYSRGPPAELTSGSILFDAEFQEEQLRALQLAHPEVCIIGCVHRHPGGFDECSNGDELTDREAVEDSGLGALVFGIITVNNPKGRPVEPAPRQHEIRFLRHGGGVGFRYVKNSTGGPGRGLGDGFAGLCSRCFAGVDCGALGYGGIAVPAGFGRFTLQFVE